MSGIIRISNIHHYNQDIIDGELILTPKQYIEKATEKDNAISEDNSKYDPLTYQPSGVCDFSKIYDTTMLMYIDNSNDVKMSEPLIDTFSLHDKWNINSPETPHTCFVVGKRDTGKTTLVRDIIKHMQKINEINLIKFRMFANTFPELVHWDYNAKYVEIFLFTYKQPNCEYNNNNIKIIDEYDSTFLGQIIEKQEQPNAKPIIIIFDDVFYDIKRINEDSNFEKVILKSRELNIFSIVIAQYSLGLKPSIRTSFDMVFLFKDDYVPNRKRLYEHFSCMPSFDAFNKLMESLQQYQCIVLDRLPSSEDKIGYYKVNIDELSVITYYDCTFCEKEKIGKFKCKYCEDIILCEDCRYGDDITPEGVADACCDNDAFEKYIEIN